MSASEVVERVLAHHGVKGMRWGIRRDRSSSVTVTDKRKRIKTSGGRGLPANADAIRARTIGQRAKGSGLKALSNDELREFQNRLNLEQNVRRLQYNDAPVAKKFALTLVGKTGQQQAQDVANQAASKQVAKLMTRIGKK